MPPTAASIQDARSTINVSTTPIDSLADLMDALDLAVTGQVSVIIRGGTRTLDLAVDNLHVEACDCRRYSE